jgi:hypothetical protein
MSSIPDILSGVDLIPHLDSPASMTPSPRPGSPTQHGIGAGPHRSKTAPPPGPPPPPDFSSPVHAPLISSDASWATRGDAAPTVPPPRTSPLPTTTASTSTSTSVSTSASRPHVSPPKHNPSAIRRSSSSLSSSSNPAGGSREKKRLRFTPVHRHDEPESSSAPPSNENSDEDVFFPGQGYSLAERGEWRGHGHGHGHGGEHERGKGRSGTKGIPRDQVDYLRSDPGTPNISET